MDGFKHCFKILEFDKILKQLVDFVCCEETKKFVLKIKPSTNLQIVQTNLNEVDEALSFLQRHESFDFLKLKSPILSLKRASLGSVLTPLELLNLGFVLKQSRLILKFYENNLNAIDNLKLYFTKLQCNKNLEDEIFKVLISENFISDDASEKLKLIRKEMTEKKHKIKNILNNFIKGDKKKYLQDLIISIKNGRYVVAVKSQFVGLIHGQVQDFSSTKATVFVEPAEIVSLSNELKILESKEKIEIEINIKLC